jgi:amidase
MALCKRVPELPATVAPVGLTESGLPVGVQIDGDRFEDRTAIDFALSLGIRGTPIKL